MTVLKAAAVHNGKAFLTDDQGRVWEVFFRSHPDCLDVVQSTPAELRQAEHDRRVRRD
jgi:hypothetical protein